MFLSVYSTLLTGIGTVRQTCQEVWAKLKSVRDSTEEIYQTGVAHSSGKIEGKFITPFIQSLSWARNSPTYDFLFINLS